MCSRLLPWIGLLLIMVSTSAADAASGQAAAGCTRETASTGTADQVVDGRTVILGDGREIRLAGIEVPSGAPGLAAQAALRGLLSSSAIVLKNPSFSDRYGRLVAPIFVLQEGVEQSVALAMLAAGHAFVAPGTDVACGAEYFAAERTARRAKLGLWSDPYYEIMSADSPEAVSARRGRFALVDGKVVSVRESGGTIYVNFGRRWSEDFTVTLSKRNERSFVDAGIEPKKLEGRRVRVRGWVEEHGGPWIEALHPAQIEIVNQ